MDPKNFGITPRVALRDNELDEALKTANQALDCPDGQTRLLSAIQKVFCQYTSF